MASFALDVRAGERRKRGARRARPTWRRRVRV